MESCREVGGRSHVTWITKTLLVLVNYNGLIPVKKILVYSCGLFAEASALEVLVLVSILKSVFARTKILFVFSFN